MSKQLRIVAHSVPAVKLPTEFAELTADLTTYEKPYTDCSGCENLGAPDSVLQKLIRAIRTNPELVWDHWNPQDPNLRGKIARLHRVDVDQVFLTSGALSGIDYCFRIFTTKGTITGFLRPEWPGFEHYADFNRNQKRYVENLRFPFAINSKMVSEFASREQLDFMIFANPVPVNGNLIPVGEVEEILRDNPATMFIVDEADTVSPDTQAAHLATEYENVVFLGSLSKFYGLSGLRIGYLITPKRYAEAFRNTINVIEVSSLAIIAGNTVIQDDTYQRQTQRNVVESIRILEEACKGTSYKIAATPHCFACYIFSETRDPRDDLGEYGIKILPGQYFGLPDDVNGGRFNLSDPANAKLVADKIKLIHGRAS